MHVKFDASKHDENNANVYTNEDGVRKVKIVTKYCKMKFGEFLKYDKLGENNLTRGKDRVIYGHIDFDDNGQPRYVGRRNHPRVLQEPYSFPYYGANNDTQKFLIALPDADKTQLQRN